jgi:hypothetical protein
MHQTELAPRKACLEPSVAFETPPAVCAQEVAAGRIGLPTRRGGRHLACGGFRYSLIHNVAREPRRRGHGSGLASPHLRRSAVSPI